MESSCLMLMMTLYTAVDLDFVISESDLAKDGIETDHHITIFYANDIIVPKNNLLEDAKDILGEDTGYQELTNYLKDPDKVWPLYDIFGLDKFENQDFDVLVMRMKETSPLFEIVDDLNSGYTKKYNLKSDFDEYRPHMTLAYLEPGRADKYLSDTTLDLVLRDSKVSFDDLVISHKFENSEQYKHWYLTNYNCIARHLRQEKLLRNKLRNE